MTNPVRVEDNSSAARAGQRMDRKQNTPLAYSYISEEQTISTYYSTQWPQLLN